MPAAENVLSTFLSSVSPSYRHPDLTKRDVLSLIHHYKGLTPKPDKFMFNDGRERDLLQLQGTIPVPYKGQTYNIPISLWLLDTHPYHAPLAFVKPTADMQVKVSKHVDSAGKIYLPYLHEWNHPNSDLLGLVQICIVTFSEQPPVYAKPKNQQNLPYPIHTPQYPQTGYPPYAATPGYPPQGQSSGYPPYQNVGYPPGGGYPPANNYYPPAGANAGYQPSGNAGYPPYTAGSQSGGTRPNTASSIGSEHIKASILSAVEDKVRRRLREDISQGQAECDSLKRTQEELNEGQNKLNNMLAKIKNEEEALETNIQVLESKKSEMNDMLEKMEDSDEICCDEAVDPSFPLYKQLFNAFAEEAAIEDAIYFLGEALRKGSIDVEVFLKQARDLSRKQFMLRATMMMCRTKAGLDQ